MYDAYDIFVLVTRLCIDMESESKAVTSYEHLLLSFIVQVLLPIVT